MKETRDITVKQDFSLTPSSLKEAMEFAKIMSSSDLVPKDYKGKPENVLLAVQMGAEIGLKPMQAIQNIALINGRPSVWGDALLAACQSHPDFEWIEESDDGTTATCKVKRKSYPEHVVKFSMDDAKRAGLMGKAGPWTQYPARMRQMRARAFALRDKFADALKGIHSAEESQDLVTEVSKKDEIKSLIKKINSEVVSQNEIIIAEPIEVSAVEINCDSSLLTEVLHLIENAKILEDLEKPKSLAKDLSEEDKNKARLAFQNKKKELTANWKEELEESWKDFVET